MYIWGKGRVAGRVGSSQTFCRHSRVGSGQRFARSGLRKVTRGQLWSRDHSQYMRLLTLILPSVEGVEIGPVELKIWVCAQLRAMGTPET